MTWLQENFPVFSLQELRDQVTNDDGDVTYLAFLSGTTKALILSSFRTMDWTNTRWYVDSQEDSELGNLTDSEKQEIFTFVERAWEEVMSSTDTLDFFADVKRIANALEVQQNCCTAGSGGSGVTQETASTFEDDGHSTYPDGFDDRSEYEQYKCNVAEFILDSIYHDIEWLQNADLVTASVEILIAALITPIPLDELAVAVFLLLAMIGEATLDTVMEEIIDEFDDNWADLRCILYTASNVDDAQASLVAQFDGDLLSATAVSFVTLFLNNDNFNKLFSLDDALPVFADVDCSSCGEGIYPVQMVYGTWDDDITFTSAPYTDASYHKERLEILFQSDAEYPPGPISRSGSVTINSVTKNYGFPLSNPSAPIILWRLCNVAGTWFYESDTEPSWPVAGISQINIVSAEFLPDYPDEFQIELSWTVD